MSCCRWCSAPSGRCWARRRCCGLWRCSSGSAARPRCGGGKGKRLRERVQGEGGIMRSLFFVLWAVLGLAPPAVAADRWSPAHIVIVILENKSFSGMIGDAELPYLNALARQSALMTRAYFSQTPYGIVPAGYSGRLPARPSQPNYLYLFSGHHQGVLPKWFQDAASPYMGTAINDSSGNRLPAPISNTPIGIDNNVIPASLRPFTTPNLGAALIASGRSFASFSESLPYPRYDGAGDLSPAADLYRRKHN